MQDHALTDRHPAMAPNTTHTALTHITDTQHTHETAAAPHRPNAHPTVVLAVDVPGSCVPSDDASRMSQRKRNAIPPLYNKLQHNPTNPVPQAQPDSLPDQTQNLTSHNTPAKFL